MKSNSWLWSSITALAALVAVQACAADSGGANEGDELTPIGEGSDEVRSRSKLIGTYGQGQGRFMSLTLTQVTAAGKKQNFFEANEVDVCGRPPCPTTALKGRWYASGTFLSLYPEGRSPLTFTAKLAGNRLTLSDKHGTALAQLERKLSAAPGVADALAKHGVQEVKVTIDPAEVIAQGAAAGVTVPFATAVDEAVALFLTDESALYGFVREIDPEEIESMGCLSSHDAERVKCVANSAASMRLQTRTDSTAPHGELVKDNWIFVFSDGLSDYGYFAIVPKRATKTPYIYKFN